VFLHVVDAYYSDICGNDRKIDALISKVEIVSQSLARFMANNVVTDVTCLADFRNLFLDFSETIFDIYDS
jgi:hypothetical protein